MCDWEKLYCEAETPEQANGIAFAHEMWERSIFFGHSLNTLLWLRRANLELTLAYFPDSEMNRIKLR